MSFFPKGIEQVVVVVVGPLHQWIENLGSISPSFLTFFLPYTFPEVCWGELDLIGVSCIVSSCCSCENDCFDGV